MRPSVRLWLLLLLCLAACSGEDRLTPPESVEPLPPAAFPLEISANRRHLVDQQDRPFFLHGDSAWSLISGARREDVERYLADRRSRGFTTLNMVLIDHTDPLQNAYGEAPFTVDGDFSTANENYFAHADWVIERAAAAGFLVWLSPIYLGYGGGDEGFYQDMVAAGPDAMRAWGQWVGERYREVDGLVWLMGGDYVPPADGLDLLAKVVEGIVDRDDRHLFAAHWARETSGWEVDVPWLDLNTTYTAPPVYPQSLEDRDALLAPLVLLEALYENEFSVTLPQLRAQAYHALLSGSAGHFFGSYPVWKFAPGWEAGLASDGAISMTHLRNLFVGLAWWTLQPDTGSGLVRAGRGPGGSEDFMTVARDLEGGLALLHLPTPREIELDLTSMKGPVRARWFDPTNGDFAPASSASPVEGGTLTLAPQAANGAGDPDWLLVLDVE